jgi:hypothetical protein
MIKVILRVSAWLIFALLTYHLNVCRLTLDNVYLCRLTLDIMSILLLIQSLIITEFALFLFYFWPLAILYLTVELGSHLLRKYNNED